MPWTHTHTHTHTYTHTHTHTEGHSNSLTKCSTNKGTCQYNLWRHLLVIIRTILKSPLQHLTFCCIHVNYLAFPAISQTIRTPSTTSPYVPTVDKYKFINMNCLSTPQHHIMIVHSLPHYLNTCYVQFSLVVVVVVVVL